jgi:hypothetical protein
MLRGVEQEQDQVEQFWQNDELAFIVRRFDSGCRLPLSAVLLDTVSPVLHIGLVLLRQCREGGVRGCKLLESSLDWSRLE